MVKTLGLHSNESLRQQWWRQQFVPRAEMYLWRVAQEFEKLVIKPMRRLGFLRTVCLRRDKRGRRLSKGGQLLRHPIYRASKAGEPPGVRTRHLRDNVDTWRGRKALEICVGTAGVKYDLYLERGTVYMAPRPHYAPALAQLKAMLKRRVR